MPLEEQTNGTAAIDSGEIAPGASKAPRPKSKLEVMREIRALRNKAAKELAMSTAKGPTDPFEPATKSRQARLEEIREKRAALQAKKAMRSTVCEVSPASGQLVAVQRWAEPDASDLVSTKEQLEISRLKEIVSEKQAESFAAQSAADHSSVLISKLRTEVEEQRDEIERLRQEADSYKSINGGKEKLIYFVDDVPGMSVFRNFRRNLMFLDMVTRKCLRFDLSFAQAYEFLHKALELNGELWGLADKDGNRLFNMDQLRTLEAETTVVVLTLLTAGVHHVDGGLLSVSGLEDALKQNKWRLCEVLRSVPIRSTEEGTVIVTYDNTFLRRYSSFSQDGFGVKETPNEKGDSRACLHIAMKLEAEVANRIPSVDAIISDLKKAGRNVWTDERPRDENGDVITLNIHRFLFDLYKSIGFPFEE